MKSLEINTKRYKCTGCNQKLDLSLPHRNKRTGRYICVLCECYGRVYSLIPRAPRASLRVTYGLDEMKVVM